jgi:hypothetical protein
MSASSAVDLNAIVAISVGPQFSAVRGVDRTKVIVRAVGVNPTTGYNPRLRVDPARIEPPFLDFENRVPSGYHAQQLTPYDVTLELLYPINEEVISIRHGSGMRRIAIQGRRCTGGQTEPG